MILTHQPAHGFRHAEPALPVGGKRHDLDCSRRRRTSEVTTRLPTYSRLIPFPDIPPWTREGTTPSGQLSASKVAVTRSRAEKQGLAGKSRKSLPARLGKILPSAFRKQSLTDCDDWGNPIEEASKQDPVVAPAGAALRVRLTQTLHSERSRSGERSTNYCNSASVAALRWQGVCAALWGRGDLVPKAQNAVGDE
jgi:hypothetical protein